MTPTTKWLKSAETRIRKVLLELRPKLLEAQGHIEHELKKDNTIVTKMDVLVEERLRETLHEFAPQVGFAGEETGADYDQKTFWLVDPIDGTEPFTRGLPFATNIVTLVHEGKVRLGVIYNFATDEFFSAIEGQGAFCNGHPIHVSERPLERSFITLRRIFDHPHGPQFEAAILGRVFAQLKVGASGYEQCLVAQGATEAHVGVYNNRGKPWDYAAGALLVSEAGGQVANIGSDTYDFRDTSFVAATPVVFDELMRLIQDFDASSK